MTTVPAIVWDGTGLQIPTPAQVLTGTLTDINNAFGGNLNPALNTPQGQIASSEAQVISDSDSNWAFLINQIDPETSSGIYQDALGSIYEMTRNPALPTSIQCTCIGLYGTVIPVGAMAQDNSGNTYACTQAGTIPISGTITLSFANLKTGAIPCPANTLTRIYQQIAGWDTINNPADGVIGIVVESQSDFEFRRKATLAANANGSYQSIYGAVFNVANVTDCYVYENNDGSPITVGSTSYSIAAHSIYIAVSGGLAADIGKAIAGKKGTGCGMVGNTTVTVQDTNMAQPYPSYTITYNTPIPTPIYFNISIVNNPLLPSNVIQLIQQSIINAFSGADGGQRARIGSTIYAVGRYANAVSSVSSQVELLSIAVGLSLVGANLSSLTLGIDRAPTIAAGNILVTPS